MRKRIEEDVESLVMEGVIDQDQADLIMKTVEYQITSTVEALKGMITEWQMWNGSDDYYPLAIYRVIDIIEGRSSLDLLPILETKDTPDE